MAEVLACGEAIAPAGVICRHHWLLGYPDGRVTHGICKVCGAERAFVNEVAGAAWGESVDEVWRIHGDQTPMLVRPETWGLE